MTPAAQLPTAIISAPGDITPFALGDAIQVFGPVTDPQDAPSDLVGPSDVDGDGWTTCDGKAPLGPADADSGRYSTCDGDFDDTSNRGYIGAGYGDSSGLPVELTGGLGLYTFFVYKGGALMGDQECAATVSGSDDYNASRGDVNNHTQAFPTDQCGPNSATLNDCTHYTNSYWIQVLRDPIQALDCTQYQITVTNNAP